MMKKVHEWKFRWRKAFKQFLFLFIHKRYFNINWRCLIVKSFKNYLQKKIKSFLVTQVKLHTSDLTACQQKESIFKKIKKENKQLPDTCMTLMFSIHKLIQVLEKNLSHFCLRIIFVEWYLMKPANLIVCRENYNKNINRYKKRPLL